MKRKTLQMILFPLLATCVAFGFVFFTADIHKEIKRQNEREIKAKIESAFGKVYVMKGEPDKILVADIKFDSEKKSSADIRYSVDGSIGRLSIDMGDRDYSYEQDKKGRAKRGININFEEGKWYLGFTDAIPISFDVELGAGKGEFDMSGLMVKGFKLSTGASKVTVTFNQPNRMVMDNMSIETGLGQFVGQKLGNANFRKFKFEGGVGSYTLDFSGELRRETSVDIELGLGSVTIMLPKNIGARINYDEHWFSSHSFDNFTERQDGEYYSYNYNDADGRINIRVSSGLGHVKVRWVNETK